MAKTTKYVENSKMHVHPKTVRYNQHSPTPIALKPANAGRAKVVVLFCYRAILFACRYNKVEYFCTIYATLRSGQNRGLPDLVPPAFAGLSATGVVGC